MKWGGEGKISSFEAIISLLIIATICICSALILQLMTSRVRDFKSLIWFLLIISVISIIGVIIIWQKELNDVFKSSRSDLLVTKPIWNIFQIGEKKGGKNEKKNF